MYRTVIGAGGGYFLGLFCAAIASNGEGLFRLRQSSTFAEIMDLIQSNLLAISRCCTEGVSGFCDVRCGQKMNSNSRETSHS
jgi:hypothetical protein